MRTIGIKLADGSFYPIMEEGSTQKKTLELTTAHNNQTCVMVDLYRSKNCTMDDAEYIDTLKIENLNEHPNGEPNISFDIALDQNGELSASINDPETGASSNSEITLVSRTMEERLHTDDYSISDSDDTVVESSDEKSGIGAGAAVAAGIAGVAAGAGLMALANNMKKDNDSSEENPEDSFTLGDPEFNSSNDDEPIDIVEEDSFDMPDEETMVKEEDVSFDSPVAQESVATDETVGADDALSENDNFVAEESILSGDTLSSNDTLSSGDETILTDDTVSADDTLSLDEDSFADDTIPSGDENLSADEDIPSDDTFSFDETALSADDTASANENLSADDTVSGDENFSLDDTLSSSDTDFSGNDAISEINNFVADESITSEDSVTSDDTLSSGDETILTDENLSSDDTVSADDNLSLDEDSFADDTLSSDDTASANENLSADNESEDSFDLPDFTENIMEQNEETQVNQEDLFADIPDEGSENLEESESNDFFEQPAASNGLSFTGLYDKETEMGDSSNHSDENNNKKTKSSVIICIICAIICIIATALVLFVIPGKFNLIDSIKNKKNKSQTAIEKTVEPVKPAEETKTQSAPLAKEDEVIVIEKAEEVKPLPPPAEEKAPEGVTYKIKWGDTLWDIADTYYKNPWRYKKIASYNNIKNPDYIISGTIITIPAE